MHSLNDFNPREHLVQIKTKQGFVSYYPAAWRLYQLHLLYPNANFASEIMHLDPERDFVIVKCRLYLGPDYQMSDKKAEAMKQGPLSQLDKIETAAKARCARDFGVSTELALDMDEGESTAPANDIKTIQLAAKSAGIATNKEQWTELKVRTLGSDVPNANLQAVHLAELRRAIEEQMKQVAA